MRLDLYLTQNKLFSSRNQAQAAIEEGRVKVDGETITKPSFRVTDQQITLVEAPTYVGRAGKKLALFLKETTLPIRGREALDIGSSTGGFVEVLLREGAKHVTAVDVGRGQLHPSLREDSRVLNLERTDIRTFEAKKPFELITCDVSFVGIGHILPAIERLSCGDIVLLFKPQYEVGPHVKRDARGVVKDRTAIIRAQKRFEAECAALGWRLCFMSESKVKGKEGNVEIFYHYTKR